MLFIHLKSDAGGPLGADDVPNDEDINGLPNPPPVGPECPDFPRNGADLVVLLSAGRPKLLCCDMKPRW